MLRNSNGFADQEDLPMWKIILITLIWAGVGVSATILYEDVLMIVAIVAALPTMAIMLA